MSRCFGYVRVSSDKQAREGTSLEAQEAKIRGYAAAKDLGEVLLFVDGGETGDTPLADREAGKAMLAAVRPGDQVVVNEIDRGFRNLADFLNWFDRWLQTGVHLHVVDFGGNSIDPRTGIGRLFFTMCAAFAEWELKKHGDRIRAVNAYMKSQGKYCSPNVPVGFKAVKDKHGKGYYCVPDPEVRRLTGQLLDWYLAGKTHAVIARHCHVNKIKLPHKKAVSWTKPYVAKLCQKEAKLREKEKKGETA